MTRLCTGAALVVLGGLFGNPGIAAPAECSAAPGAVISLSYGSRYAEFDAQRATLDPFRDAAVDSALEPLEAFIDDLAERTSGLYSGSPQQTVASATCILDQLASWAKAGALSDLGSDTTKLTIGARIAAFAMITWQAAAFAPQHPARAEILEWLTALQDGQIEFWGQAPPGAQRGNLRAWAALAAAALSIQTDRADFAAWSHRSLREVMCTADAAGSLPQEMTRGRFALHYQLHAVAPLVTATLLLEQQAIPTRHICDNALDRIVAFTVTDLTSGEKTKAITGVTQTLTDGTNRLAPYQIAWLESYQSLVPSAQFNNALEPLRPLKFSKLGGDQTALWARQ